MEQSFADSQNQEDETAREYSRAASPEADSSAESGEALTEAELRDWVRLAFVALPATRCNAALQQWQTPGALLSAAQNGRDDDLLQTSGITPKTVERLREAAAINLQPALDAMGKFAIRLLLARDAEYPAALRVIDDPPPYLFVRGRVLASDEVAVALVGTRHVTEYGRSVAEKISLDLARRGVTVVSGLARGVDTAAHRGALDGGGRTFAVCGCGLDVSYPPDNRALMEKIADGGGALFSEFAPTVTPLPWHFPARNRIISGLSAGVIVVEAAERSGALITADFAMEQGREVFAVPGNIWKPQARGCHMLIKQGATLIESADDAIAALNNRALPFERAPRVLADTSETATSPDASLKSATTEIASAAPLSAASHNELPRVLAGDENAEVAPPKERRAAKTVRASTCETADATLPSRDAAKTVRASTRETSDATLQSGSATFGEALSQVEPKKQAATVQSQLSADENRVWLALDDEPKHLDAIAESAAMTTQSVNASLVLMELKGFVRRLPGNQFTRVL